MSNRISINDEQQSLIKKVMKLYGYEDFAAACQAVVNTGISRKFALKKYSDKQDEKPAKKSKKDKGEKKAKKKSKEAKAASADRPKKSKKSNGEKKAKKPKKDTAEASAEETISLN